MKIPDVITSLMCDRYIKAMMHPNGHFYPYASIDFTVKYDIKRAAMPRLRIA